VKRRTSNPNWPTCNSVIRKRNTLPADKLLNDRGDVKRLIEMRGLDLAFYVRARGHLVNF